MIHQFRKHYSLSEANALLPEIRAWFADLALVRKDLAKQDRRLQRLSAPGRDLGGPAVDAWVRSLAKIKAVLDQFSRREIQIKDLDRGLIDFPAIIAGKEVFLCWELSEKDIGFYHDLDAGYSGRERLEDTD
jgi:hypothetical protein